MLYPSYSYCKKCKLPWKFCAPKTIPTSEGDGIFFVCCECWNNSTIKELKKYYIMVYKKQLVEESYQMDYTLKHFLECIEKEYKQNKKYGKV